MKDLVVKQDNALVIIPEVSQQIAEIEQTIKALEAQREEYRQALFNVMTENNIIKFDTPELMIDLVKKNDTEQFDKKAFKNDHPELYDEYITMKPGTTYIMIKTK